MPRENRKRGRKRRREDEEPTKDTGYEPQHSRPSWIISAPKDPPEYNAAAPFGYVNADVKAYFRTVDIQIRGWQNNQAESSDGGDGLDPNEEKQLFFSAALREVSGMERQLVTDPECSIILERMMYSMDDFVRRVFADCLAGSYEKLVRHRFASHACQTLFEVAADTVSRECQGFYPAIPNSPDRGELLTMAQLVLNACEELLPTFTSLIMDPFASHVIRALLFLLCPNLSPSAQLSGSAHRKHSIIRSKKSAAWKVRQGVMTSVFRDNRRSHSAGARRVPSEFIQAACKFVHILRDQSSENEVRALAADKVASPVLRILLEIESDQDIAASPGSLMDQVMVGLITSCRENPGKIPEPSDFIVTLLRDPTSSHLLEVVVKSAPNDAFNILWSTYFHRKLPQLANHPVANFVVAKAMERVSVEQLGEACGELVGTWPKIIKSSRTGVLRAAIDRASVLRACEKEVVDATLSAFELKQADDRSFFLPCVLRVMPVKEYNLLLSQTSEAKFPDKTYDKDAPTEAKTQGVILLQSLLHLPGPHNSVAINSINALSPNEMITLAHHPTSSRVLDTFLESNTVPYKAKLQLVVSLIGHFHLLVDDRIGSRVGDRILAFADPHLKEKIAHSLMPHETSLLASPYGKFFTRHLSLHLLRRRPHEWKRIQAEQEWKKIQTEQDRSTLDSATDLVQPHNEDSSSGGRRKKRKSLPEDEIDAVFNTRLGKKTKQEVPEIDDAPTKHLQKGADRGQQSLSIPRNSDDTALQEVLSAIRAVQKGGKKGRKIK